jgi:hypothetical protein
MSNTYGMNNPFIVQNGLIVNANAVVTGSISSSLVTANRFIIKDQSTVYMDAKLATGVSSPQTIDSFTGSLGNSCKWLLSINDGTNFETSEVMFIWNQNTEESRFTQYGTNAIGTVDGFISASMSSGYVNLHAGPNVGTWNIKILRTIL